MHLRSLTLKGFKSFPDRTRLEFATGVSVVVGPNGSGKSNVTDAVLWAMGEQSPLAVRGQSMQDVIFAGGHGVQAREQAEVEVVLDNTDGALDLPASEIAIARRLDRTGEGEYRINGARCRLVDVLELLSDTGLGKEMHSVVSQGRIEQIVTSKPRDRRLLIEEAAGLGKHRTRRRRAQLKLDRTQDNLDRALDVEREARTRLRPLKRQAEAAELHARLERQTDEAHWALRRDDLRAARSALAAAEAEATAARAAHAAVERELAGLRERREAAELALAARASEREALGNRVYAARSAAERIGLRLETARAAVATLEDRTQRRRALVAGLEAEPGDEDADPGAEERVATLGAELEQLAQDRHERLARELAELQERLAEAAAETARLTEQALAGGQARREADDAAEAARRARREAETAAEAARREAARVGAELAAVNQFLRSHAGAPGGAPALADALRADAGYELALAAALGPRLRAAVAGDLAEAGTLLDRAGRDGGAALVAREGSDGLVVDDRTAALVAGEGGEVAAADGGSRGPGAGAEPLLARVHAEGDGAAARLARRMLADVWVVDDLSGLAADFDGIAVTRTGRVWSPRTCELRQLPGGGEDRVLAERNRRDELVASADGAARAEHAALAEVERASAAVVAAEAARDDADRADRAAARARDEAAEAERHAGWLIEQRRSGPDEGPAATRRAQLAAALAAERRLAERAERERRDREQRLALEHDGLARDAALHPLAARFVEALEAAGGAVADRLQTLQAELDADRQTGERLAGELRECAATESAAHGRLSESAEAVTGREVRAQQARDRAEEAQAALGTLAAKLGLPTEPAVEALDAEERAGLEARLSRLLARREQLGPVNPLAQDEYAEALAHVEELEAQREDLETALRELEGLIRDTDRRIREAFEETFTAAASNFEEVVEHLFPGGRGRLRLVREDSGPRPVLGGADPEGPAPTDEERIERAAEAEAQGPGDPDDGIGVEIEITPAGKATRRLSLLSGGEKSLTALAFLFAVFLARPCPFYILDEVEAALDDLNIDRFLALLRRFSGRAQFIVVTHQKRTMEAADCLYGVSMAGNGVSKVVSRRLPERAAA
jgi:chromosome segregation protein